LGFLFIFVTVFMPKGIIGLPGQFREIKQRLQRRNQPAPDPVASAAAATQEGSGK